MKTIIVSVKPRYAEQIMNGIKTIEVRKFYIEPPFKVYNYVTKGGNDKLKNQLLRLEDTGECVLCSTTDLSKYKLNGKVAYEYVVNKVDTIINNYSNFYVKGEDVAYTNRIANQSCLQFPDLRDYSKGKSLYAWHISDLKIYDKPKELGEFITKCKYYDPWYMSSACSDSDCPYLKIKYGDNGKEMWCGRNGEKAITRPPQNFVYVEEI